MSYLYLKSLHLIFVITWFCGLFYSVRLLIYHAEAMNKEKIAKDILVAQFKIMEKRLWFGITWPSMILTLLFGFSMIHQWFPLQNNQWLMIKLSLVFLLILYHFSVGYLIKQFKHDQVQYSSQQLRIWNEVPTLFLFAIVFLAVLKNGLNALNGVIVLLCLAFALFIAIRVYKKLRKV